ncbi:hypothetical protein JT359_16990 [Candidatus Poribacteria bacterium]|nr:hypothetical protein [Candidatus Poribacteria bacterium]
MIKKALEHFQKSPNMTDNIMPQVAQPKPTPSSRKPLIQWVVAASTAVLIALMLGIGNQHLARFQIPYSLEVQSDMSLELLDIPRQNPDKLLFAAAEVEDGDVSKPEKTTLDLEMILAGIKYNDQLVKTGEIKVVSTLEVNVVPSDENNHSDSKDSTIIFDSDRIRFDTLSKKDSISRSTILLPNSTWIIKNYADTNKKPSYDFHTYKHKYQFPVIDPRNVYSVNKHDDLQSYLRNENFQIQRTETLNDTICYVLEKKYTELSEEKQSDTFTRIWISPEQGFRYVKFEAQEPNKTDGNLNYTRVFVTHQKFGEIWFPRIFVSETTRFDTTGNKITSLTTLTTKDFKLNHPILPKTFTVEIPNDAILRVNNRKISNVEFLKKYKQE